MRISLWTAQFNWAFHFPQIGDHCFLLQFSFHDRKQLSWHPTSRWRYRVQLPRPITPLTNVYILTSQPSFPSPHLERACMITTTTPSADRDVLFNYLPHSPVICLYITPVPVRHTTLSYILLPDQNHAPFRGHAVCWPTTSSRPEPCSLPRTCCLLTHCFLLPHGTAVLCLIICLSTLLSILSTTIPHATT